MVLYFQLWQGYENSNFFDSHPACVQMVEIQAAIHSSIIAFDKWIEYDNIVYQNVCLTGR